MKQKWLIPSGVAVCALAFTILWSQAASQAQNLPSDLVWENRAWGQLGNDEVVGPASLEVRVTTTDTITVYLPQVPRRWAAPAFTVTKTADPTQANATDAGALIDYTVVFKNKGTVDAGVLADIRDTLPAGFTFVQMVTGSDITANPTGTTGQIVWNGPFVVQPESSITVIYQVRASSQPGTYVNQATATTSVGEPPEKPAGAPVELRIPILLADTFDSDAERWTEFLNGEHLSDEQWFWKPRAGLDGGCYNHARDRDPDEQAVDALSMYLGAGSKRWTNYRYEAWVWLDPDSEHDTSVGLWFRGHYAEDDDLNQWVLGYYFNVTPGKDRVEYWQTQTEDDCIEDACSHNRLRYNFENPMMLDRQPYVMGEDWLGEWHKIAVEVWGDEDEGTHMAGYVDDVLLIEFTDTEGTIIPNGTVGLAVYKAPLIRFDNIKVTALD